MSLLKKAFTGDVTACIFYLSNRSPDRWKRNGQVDVQISSAPAKEQMSLEQVIAQYGDVGREAASSGFTQGVQDALESGYTP